MRDGEAFEGGIQMTLILIAGMPATGKSTLAAYLSKTLGFPVFSKDSIKETLFDTLGFSSRAEKVRLGVAANEIMLNSAKSCLICGQSCILENNFETATNPELQKMIEQTGARTITVLLTGDFRSSYSRFAMRDQSPERHRGHVVNDCYPEKPGSKAKTHTIDFETFVSGMTARGMNQPPVGGTVIEVDTTNVEQIDMESITSAVRETIGM